MSAGEYLVRCTLLCVALIAFTFALDWYLARREARRRRRSPSVVNPRRKP